MLGIVRRRRPATGGVLPGRRQTEPAGERLLPALQTGIQPELPGRRVPLPVPVERRGLADGKLSEALRIKKKKKKKQRDKEVFPPTLCVFETGRDEFALSCLVKSRSFSRRPEGRRRGAADENQMIRPFFFFPPTKPRCKMDNSGLDADWPIRFREAEQSARTCEARLLVI